MQPESEDPVWYVAYGSNLLSARFDCYLSGGRPPGALRAYVGCRDPTGPRSTHALQLPGRLTFAGVSTVWGGSLAFYDPAAQGWLAARAYLISFAQFSDVVSQEARAPVEADLLLGDPEHPRQWPAPSGVYETVLHVGDREGAPMLTITSLQDLTPQPPSAAYLRTILQGLEEAHSWTVAERVDYLLRAPGVTPTWTDQDLRELCSVRRP
jgi:hypothetical protein